MTAPTELAEKVYVYTYGLCYCSVCAPKGMSREVLERNVNMTHPTGIESLWYVADEPFKSGEPNPCQCNDDQERQHFLLVC